MKAYFISDQHLTKPDSEECQALLRFFKSLHSTEDCSHLFLVGDIFDIWAGAHDYFIKMWKPFNSELLRLVNIGVEVHYFEGNHDMLLEDYFYKQLGVQVHTSAKYFEINGKTYRIEHGDQMDPEDKGYLLLRRFWRSGPISYLLKNAPAKLVEKTGDWASGLSRKHHDAKPSEEKAKRIREFTDAHIKKVYQEKPFDIFVAGHVHLKDERNLEMPDGKTVLAVNLGFQEPPISY